MYVHIHEYIRFTVQYGAWVTNIFMPRGLTRYCGLVRGLHNATWRQRHGDTWFRVKRNILCIYIYIYIYIYMHTLLTQWKINCNHRQLKITLLFFSIWPRSPFLQPCIRPGREASLLVTVGQESLQYTAGVGVSMQRCWQDMLHTYSYMTSPAAEMSGPASGLLDHPTCVNFTRLL